MKNYNELLREKLPKYQPLHQAKLISTNIYTYSVKDFQIIKTFGRDIYEGNTMLKEVDEYQADLLDKIINFMKKNKTKKSRKKTNKKSIALENLHNFFKDREKVLDAFESKIFSIKSKGAGILNLAHSKLKILSFKQMLQRLPSSSTSKSRQ